MLSSVPLSAPHVCARALSGPSPAPRHVLLRCGIALRSSLARFPTGHPTCPTRQQVVCTLSLLSAGTAAIAQLGFLSAQAGFDTEVGLRAVDCDLSHLVACENTEVPLEVYVFACFCPGAGSSRFKEKHP